VFRLHQAPAIRVTAFNALDLHSSAIHTMSACLQAQLLGHVDGCANGLADHERRGCVPPPLCVSESEFRSSLNCQSSDCCWAKLLGRGRVQGWRLDECGLAGQGHTVMSSGINCGRDTWPFFLPAKLRLEAAVGPQAWSCPHLHNMPCLLRVPCRSGAH